VKKPRDREETIAIGGGSDASDNGKTTDYDMGRGCVWRNKTCDFDPKHEYHLVERLQGYN
jgi:hypothetical protein